MKVPQKAKVEKCASKDQTRPVLTQVFLRVVSPAVEEFGADDVATGAFEPGAGFLEATDSYKLVRVPVELEPGDEEGFIPPESLSAARKADRHNPRISANGTVDVAGGPSYPRTVDGQFPRTESLIPADSELFDFEIGLSAKLLLDLQEGFGSSAVRIRFCGFRNYRPATTAGAGETTDDTSRPSPLRPIIVRPLQGGDPESIGVLMPIRVG